MAPDQINSKGITKSVQSAQSCPSCGGSKAVMRKWPSGAVTMAACQDCSPVIFYGLADQMHEGVTDDRKYGAISFIQNPYPVGRIWITPRTRNDFGGFYVEAGKKPSPLHRWAMWIAFGWEWEDLQPIKGAAR